MPSNSHGAGGRRPPRNKRSTACRDGSPAGVTIHGSSRSRAQGPGWRVGRRVRRAGTTRTSGSRISG